MSLEDPSAKPQTVVVKKKFLLPKAVQSWLWNHGFVILAL
jgi:hypothetical protein